MTPDAAHEASELERLLGYAMADARDLRDELIGALTVIAAGEGEVAHLALQRLNCVVPWGES